MLIQRRLFNTLKYATSYPSKPFEDIEKARGWVMEFVQWYNHSHRHSNLKYVTPVQRHQGNDSGILEKRKQVYELPKARNPKQWSGDKSLDAYSGPFRSPILEISDH